MKHGLSASPTRRMLLPIMIIMLAISSLVPARAQYNVTDLLEYGYAWVCARVLPMAYVQFREAALQNAKDTESRMMMGIINHINGEDAKALELWAQAEALGESAAAVLAGDLLFTNGRLNEAEAGILRALKADPQAVKALYGLALVAEKKGKVTEAVSNLEKVIVSFNKDPYYELPQAYYHLGKLYISLNNNEAAVETLERGARLAPHDADMKLALAQAYEAAGRLPEAAHAFEHALDLAPQLAPALAGMQRLQNK